MSWSGSTWARELAFRIACAGMCAVHFLVCQAVAQDAVRQGVTAAGEVSAGARPVDRPTYESYLQAVAAGNLKPPAGGIQRCEYSLSLNADGSLTGDATGRLHLVGGPSIIAVGRPSFSMQRLQVDGQSAVWGADPLGMTCVLCPREGAEFRFDCSQQGIRRGDSLEFPLEWVTSVATHLKLAVPEGVVVETSGLLKTGERPADGGGRTLTFEAGARPTSSIRISPKSDVSRQPFGMELRQTVSATPTKVLIQSIIEIICQQPGSEVAEFDAPAGFTLLRVTLGGNERLPLGALEVRGGRFRVPLGDVTPGQRIELRLVLERPADWTQPLQAPRVAPQNGVLLHEDWVLQIEKPLELISVEAPSFVQTSLSVESAREVWTYQGTSAEGTLSLTARTPRPAWSADCYLRRQQRGPRTEIATLIELKSTRAPLFEFDVDLLKPWKMVAMTAPDAAGQPAALSFTRLEQSESATRYRVLLRSPAAPQRNALVTITAAAQSESPAATVLQPVAIPRGGTVETYFVLPNPSATSRSSAPVESPEASIVLRSLRSALRASPFFENADPDTTLIRRVVAKSDPLKPSGAKTNLEAATNAPVAFPAPLADGHSVLELQSSLGASAGDSTHRATFTFEETVDVSGAVIRFDGEWTLTDIECDGVPISGLSLPGELRLPQHGPGVRELRLRYTVPGGAESFPRRDRVVWPQLAGKVRRWIWRIDAPTDRRLSGIDAPAEFQGGVNRPALRERLLAPLGRAAGLAIFNPLRVDAWQEAFGLTAPRSGTMAAPASALVAAGFEYPRSTVIISWSSVWLEWLDWVLFVGSLLAVAILRRFRRGTFRFAGGVSAVAATCAWLLPAPLGAMAGAVFCGSLLGFVLPRRILASPSRKPAVSRGSTLIRLAGASAVVLGCFATTTTAALIEFQVAPATPSDLDGDGVPDATVLVPENIAREITAWQREQNGPAYLIRGARYEVQIDKSELALVNLEFDVIVPRPESTRSLQLPFDGLTFRGPDAAQINGSAVRLVPTADGSGVILALPVAGDAAVSGPAEYRVELAGALRVPSGGSRREFAFTMPRCPSAVGLVRSGSLTQEGFRSTARGRTGTVADGILCEIGGAARWQSRWRSGDSAGRPPVDSPMTARAESVVAAEPESLRVMTRLLIETPELSDPFAVPRLEVLLPKRAIIVSVAGETLTQWRTRAEVDGVRVSLDLASPPIVGQQFDLQYDLPLAANSLPEIPPIPLLDPLRLNNHQVAVVTSPTFTAKILSSPDPEAGLWSVAPSEASFSLRRDRGFPVPDSAIELERPVALAIELRQKATGRSAELEQSLTAASNSISWTGMARIESSTRPGFLYEFRIDPAVEIHSASVTERDVERLSRFLREGDRLLLVVGDDRLGTKNVRLEGTLKLEAGKVRPVPQFELLNASVTRREIVVTSSVDQLLQVRRDEASPLQVGRNDLEWEPVTPSSRRMALPGNGTGLVMRWINPASPLEVVEFLELPVSRETDCTIEWRLASNQQLPATLALDAPRGTQISELSDFVEENRRTLPGDRVRIELQSRMSHADEPRIRMTVPTASAKAGTGVLPRLADLAVQPVTFLAVPQELLKEYAVHGDFLDWLPEGAPAEWATRFASRQLVVFQLTGSDWRVDQSRERESIGKATAEIVASERGNQIRGATRWIVSPSQVGLLQIPPPLNGSLDSVLSSGGALVERLESGAWQLLVRPSQQIAVYAEWSAPLDPAAGGELSRQGPQLPGVDVQVVYAAVVPSPAGAEWTPEFLSQPARADQLAAIRLETLLHAARLLPIGIRPPAWLRDELFDLGRTYRSSPEAGHLSVQVEGLLDSWSARMNTLTALHSVAPAASLLTRDPQRILADGMLVAAADPEIVIEVPAGRTAWSIPRRLLNGIFVTAWLIVWTFVITKGGQWARRSELADRVARYPALVTFAIGMAWWLLLAPSVLGMLIALASIVWGAGQWYRQHRLRLVNAGGSPS